MGKKILLLTNEKSKDKILKILKKNFKNEKIITRIFSKPGLSANLKFKKNYFDYIFNFRSFLILNTRHISMAKIACINFHPSPPKYRGRGGINFALYNQDKKYGVTSHLIDEKIDHGKIILVNYFDIPKNCSVEKLFNITQKKLYIIADEVFKNLKKYPNYLEHYIKKNKNNKWSKKISTTRDMDKFYKLDIKSKKSEFLKKIISTNYKNFKPYLKIHGLKFYLN